MIVNIKRFCQNTLRVSYVITGITAMFITILVIRNVVPDNFANTFLFDKCILLTIINVLMKSTLRIISTWTMINVATYDWNAEFWMQYEDIQFYFKVAIKSYLKNS